MAAEAAKAAPIRVTVDGVEVEVARETLADDLDTLELLSDVDGGNVLAMPRLLRHVFGAEQYAVRQGGARRRRRPHEPRGDERLPLQGLRGHWGRGKN